MPAAVKLNYQDGVYAIDYDRNGIIEETTVLMELVHFFVTSYQSKE